MSLPPEPEPASPASAAAEPMNPIAELPAGEALLLSPLEPSAPFSEAAAEASTGTAALRGRKPLRPKKERQPVADAVDARQVRNDPNQVALRSVPAPSVAAPANVQVRTFRGGQDDNTSIPPDTAGAVGPQHVFNPLNNNVSIFDRNGAPIPPVVTLDQFWTALGLSGNTFDPKVMFDPFEQRFVFVTMADAERPTSSLYIAVTTGSDPTSTWVGDAIQVDDEAQGAVWLDYPSIGFTADKITVQVNLFTRLGNRFAGSTIYVFDKRSLFDPPHQATLQRFVLKNQGRTQVPAQTYDPGVADEYLVARWSGNAQGGGFLVAYQIAGNVGAGAATLTRLGFVTSGGATWDSFPPGDLAPQLGTSDKVDVGDDRLLTVCYRGGVLYCCHTVLLPTGGPTRSAVQWWEIDQATWTVNLLGRIDDPEGSYYAFPSLAVSERGDLLIGMSQFSASIHASAAYVYRSAGAAAVTAVVFAQGLDTYHKTFGGSDNRWGDYSATQSDPESPNDFWTVQEYAEAPADTWGTMWAHITVPPLVAAAASRSRPT